ncbi:6-phosphogluconolactonase [Trichoplax sp. H2]|uniref:6-phosphogluconolactonase n=1 Tax=Trichoplax adhaerens TaxID=10228 RepID=B3RVC2_TRIAD|nr:hypothetical protein TRIADDRAFT_23609 [Trichoplax adhaerens]EDV25967.1 hypothetical protein TRIADDRAFT_23609 [Trichoplax adhaerens]RDD44126.1 6-phosphogluconolactonase [Trichoplax sp. H2]|eukprot:XP_002112000.1 hypothetical protein TRIADDRAFT_23609 [Trichoplax adhaerens]
MASVRQFEDKASLGQDLCKYIAEKSSQAIQDHGFFTIGFSGGSLPSIVGNSIQQVSCDYGHWQVLLCDERYVSLDDKESNYNAYKQHIGRKLPTQVGGEIILDYSLPLEAAAADYEKKLRSLYPGVSIPSLDLLLLGMGPDGHTCSLFPGHSLLTETSSLVSFISDSPKPPPQRITLTYPIINAAKSVAFVCTGEAKADVLKKIICDNDQSFPSARVKLTNGEHIWFLDRGAASKLQ